MSGNEGVAAPRLSLCLIVKDEADLLPDCLDSMAEVDREIIALRHFEQLNSQEVADVQVRR